MKGFLLFSFMDSAWFFFTCPCEILTLNYSITKECCKSLGHAQTDEGHHFYLADEKKLRLQLQWSIHKGL